MSPDEREKSLWRLANSITGLTTAKDVALGCALLSKPSSWRWPFSVTLGIGLMVVVLCIVNCCAVLGCHTRARGLL